MFTGWLSRGIVGLAVAVMAPVAFACENPDDITIALRDTVPEVVEPGEIVLELDLAGIEIIKAREEVIKLDKPATKYPSGEPGSSEIRYVGSYATFPVVRVVQGDFAGALARIDVSLWSTCQFISGPEGKFLIGRPVTDRDGISYIKARWLRAVEFDTQHEQDREATH